MHREPYAEKRFSPYFTARAIDRWFALVRPIHSPMTVTTLTTTDEDFAYAVRRASGADPAASHTHVVATRVSTGSGSVRTMWTDA